MEVKDIKKVALFGVGTMGPGLALVFAKAGYKVTMYGRRPEAIAQAMSVIKSSLDTFVESKLVAQGSVEGILNNITTTMSLEDAGKDADFVIESIAEKKIAKQVLFEQLNQICPERTIFTSNTSYLNIFEIMPTERLPQTVIAHWFAPPHIIPLVEVVRGTETSQGTIDTVVELLKKVDKVPVVMEKFLDGFCINRLLRIIGREVFFQMDNGYITPEMLDIAVKASIIPRAMVLGLVQRYDFTGLDLSAKNLENPDYLEPPIDNAPSSLVERVQRGEMGVKSGKGFFDYSDRTLEEVLKERDVKLLEVFNNSKDLMYKKI